MGFVVKDKNLRTAGQDRSEARAPEKGPQDKGTRTILSCKKCNIIWKVEERKQVHLGSSPQSASISSVA